MRMFSARIFNTNTLSKFFHSENLPIELVYGIDEVEEGTIAVNILPLLLAARPSASIDKQGDK